MGNNEGVIPRATRRTSNARGQRRLSHRTLATPPVRSWPRTARGRWRQDWLAERVHGAERTLPSVEFRFPGVEVKLRDAHQRSKVSRGAVVATVAAWECRHSEQGRPRSRVARVRRTVEVQRGVTRQGFGSDVDASFGAVLATR